MGHVRHFDSYWRSSYSNIRASPSLVVAAILGVGIFGDHCSPISDTTAVSSLAAGCDVLTHVKTQFPYALLAGD